MKRVLLSWSSGKDSARALAWLQSEPELELAGLITSFNRDAGRVAMHAVRRELVQRQAASIGLPLLEVELEAPGTNESYIRAMGTALVQAKYDWHVTHVAFGDLYLEDVREFREKQLQPLRLEPVFPLWGLDTHELAAEIVATGIKAIVTCVDPKVLPADFVGRDYNRSFLDDLPAGVDPCGENGEFHSFVWDAPGFTEAVPVVAGDRVQRGGFEFIDLCPVTTGH